MVLYSKQGTFLVPCFSLFSMITFISYIGEAISMCNKIIVLSNRPTSIKNTHIIKLTDCKDPIHNRKTKEFPYYLNIIWKEIDNDNK